MLSGYNPHKSERSTTLQTQQLLYMSCENNHFVLQDIQLQNTGVCARIRKKNEGKEMKRVFFITMFQLTIFTVISKFDPSPVVPLDLTPSSSDHGLHTTPEPPAGVGDLLPGQVGHGLDDGGLQ